MSATWDADGKLIPSAPVIQQDQDTWPVSLLVLAWLAACAVAASHAAPSA